MRISVHIWIEIGTLLLYIKVIGLAWKIDLD